MWPYNRYDWQHQIFPWICCPFHMHCLHSINVVFTLFVIITNFPMLNIWSLSSLQSTISASYFKPQLAFSPLLPTLQNQVEDEDNDDCQYNHLIIVILSMMICQSKEHHTTEIIWEVLDDDENYHSCAEAQYIFNLKQEKYLLQNQNGKQNIC